MRFLSSDLSVFVHFYVREEATAVVGFGADRPPEMITVNVTRDHLSQLPADPLGAALSDPWLCALLGTVTRWSDADDHVHLCPHGVLHGLPLHAVPVDGRPLGERNVVSFTPSATVLRHCLAKSAPPDRHPGEFLALADASTSKPLHFGRDHARALGELFYRSGRRATIYEGDEATSDSLIATLAASRMDYVHLAVHGFTDPRSGLASGVRLADGTLTARDVLRLQLDTDLVVLASCDTALSERRPGDELLGLTRSLIYAGTPTVLATLWQVDQLATSLLMMEFYQALLRGEGKASALRTAQLLLRRTTATSALDYLDGVRRRSGTDLRTRIAAELATVQLRLHAQDARRARADAAAVLDLKLTSVERRSAVKLHRLASVAARASRAPDYSRRPFDNPRYWAAFVLIGAA